MRIPHVYGNQREEPAPSGLLDVDIRPEPYFDDPGLFDDKKEYARWMERMKRMIRNSLEYQKLVRFQKRERGMDRCGIHPNITIQNGFRIEAHHTPFTLEDIVHVIVHKRLNLGESMKMTDIADEVMELHFLELVGLYPLCQLCHKSIHSASVGEKFFIPISSVRGNPEKFVEIYQEHIPQPIAMKWENLRVLNQSYDIVMAQVPEEVRKKYLYVRASKDSDSMVISTEKLVRFINEA